MGKIGIDNGTFENGRDFSKGIEYVVVDGVVVLKNGNAVDNFFLGQPVYGIHTYTKNQPSNIGTLQTIPV